MKIVALDKKYWPRGGYGHYCPGCRSGHEIDTEKPNGSGAMWKFDGNHESPTFTPSINSRWGKFADPKSDVDGGVCHYFITAGKIIYCGDSTHALKGKTIDLPDIPDHLYFTSRRPG